MPVYCVHSEKAGVTDAEQKQEQNITFLFPFLRTQKYKGFPEPWRSEQHLRGHVPWCPGRRRTALRRSLRHHDTSASQRHGHHAGVEENERGGSLHGHAQHHHRQQVNLPPSPSPPPTQTHPRDL